MTPRYSSANRLDIAADSAILFSKISRGSACVPFFPDGYNLFTSQFPIGRSFLANLPISLPNLTAFSNAISNIFFGSPQEEMVGVNARRIVANMANKQTGRYRPKLNLPTHSMSSFVPELPILFSSGLFRRLKRTGPNPTRFSFSNFIPKCFHMSFIRRLTRNV